MEENSVKKTLFDSSILAGGTFRDAPGADVIQINNAVSSGFTITQPHSNKDKAVKQAWACLLSVEHQAA